MKIALFYDDSPGTIGIYWARAFRALGHTADHFNTSEAERCHGGYEIYLRVDHGDYSHDLPRRFRPKALYAVDTHLRTSWQSIRRHAARCDLVFCVQYEAAQRLPRAHWVPLGCDPQIHAAPPTPRRHDLAFVGNDGGVPRKFYLQELRERYPNSVIGKAAYTDMAARYAQAKIGFHYIECTSPLKDHVSMRVYEILCSGTMLLANALARGAFERVGLRDREHLVVYQSPSELFALIEYYLNHADERERIAAAGRACVIQRHTYQQRAASIAAILQNAIGA